MKYNRCGQSGLLLPAISLGLWQNFGAEFPAEQNRAVLRAAFDAGITHFDLANNYGPPPGAAETRFGEILASDFSSLRDQLVISTKAGYLMWDGPYGTGGSRKYLISSLDQSLRRMRLDYVDIFYHHCPDADTPLEETMGALTDIVRQGKAIYVGISNYSPEGTVEAARLLAAQGIRCLIHQPCYNLLHRAPEKGLLQTLARLKIGCIPFCPLAQGLLTNRYLDGIPKKSRATHSVFLSEKNLTPAQLNTARELQKIAQARGQSLAQMALAWVLHHPEVTSALIGASRVEQINENVASLDRADFSPAELQQIDSVIRQNLPAVFS